VSAGGLAAPAPGRSDAERFAAVVAEAIGAARAAAEAGRRDEAVRRFDLCRALLVEAAPPGALRARIDKEARRFAVEAEALSAALRARSAPNPSRRAMVIADSLGLPRPEEAAPMGEADRGVYAGLLLDELSMRGPAAVDAHCQRFFTTDDALALVEAAPARLAGAQLYVHLGLNDCAVRMFMPKQRLAAGLLPKPLVDAVVGFAREFRVDIVRAFPDHQYVPLDRFGANVVAIAAAARRAGAAGTTFATLLTPPTKFWRRTPQVCRRFTAYNLRLMEAAAAAGAAVVDVDRMIWEEGVARLAAPDGMHLSPAGHARLARAFAICRFGPGPKRPAPVPATGAAS
jgi:hypothetical protein